MESIESVLKKIKKSKQSWLRGLQSKISADDESYLTRRWTATREESDQMLPKALKDTKLSPSYIKQLIEQHMVYGDKISIRVKNQMMQDIPLFVDGKCYTLTADLFENGKDVQVFLYPNKTVSRTQKALTKAKSFFADLQPRLIEIAKKTDDDFATYIESSDVYEVRDDAFRFASAPKAILLPTSPAYTFKKPFWNVLINAIKNTSYTDAGVMQEFAENVKTELKSEIEKHYQILLDNLVAVEPKEFVEEVLHASNVCVAKGQFKNKVLELYTLQGSDFSKKLKREIEKSGLAK